MDPITYISSSQFLQFSGVELNSHVTEFTISLTQQFVQLGTWLNAKHKPKTLLGSNPPAKISSCLKPSKLLDQTNVSQQHARQAVFPKKIPQMGPHLCSTLTLQTGDWNNLCACNSPGLTWTVISPICMVNYEQSFPKMHSWP